MANIKVQDLLAINPVGAELFSDPESFMKELSEESEEMGIIGGHCVPGSCQDTIMQCIRATNDAIVYLV